MRTLTSFVITLSAVIAVGQEPTKPQPKELVSLRDSWTKARQQATAPLDKKYLDALTALKTRFTKEGNLDAALSIDAEIKSLSLPASSATQARGEDPEKLSKRKRDEMEKAIHGEWYFTTPKGGSFGIYSNGIVQNGVFTKHSITDEGDIVAAKQTGEKVTLRMSEDGSMITGTWFDGAQIKATRTKP